MVYTELRSPKNWDSLIKKLNNFPKKLKTEQVKFFNLEAKLFITELKTDIISQRRSWAGFISNWPLRKQKNKTKKLIHLGDYINSFESDVSTNEFSVGTDAIQGRYLELGGTHNRNPARPHVEPRLEESTPLLLTRFMRMLKRILP